METIKSYTDLEQSRKLAEILPLESADMYWQSNLNGSDRQYLLDMGEIEYFEIEINFEHYSIRNYDIPAWSLTALFSVLPMITKGEDTANPFIAKTPDNEYYVVYATLTKEVDSSAIYDNPVDACVAMIEYLHGLKIL